MDLFAEFLAFQLSECSSSLFYSSFTASLNYWRCFIWLQVHPLMCSELFKLVIRVSKIFPELEAARPRCSSGIEALCLLNNGIVKAKIVLQNCNESSALYLVYGLELWHFLIHHSDLALIILHLIIYFFRHLLVLLYFRNVENQFSYSSRV